MEIKKRWLIEAGGTRIRPILMTAIATIGASFLCYLVVGFNYYFERISCYSYWWFNFINLTLVAYTSDIYEILFYFKKTIH